MADVTSAQGKSVGVMSAARISHATPASPHAHTADRNYENDTEVPEGCDVPDIAAQLISEMEAGNIDVTLCGGRRNFLTEGDDGSRTDKHMVGGAKGRGIAHSSNVSEARDFLLDGSAPLLGLFSFGHMSYGADRDPVVQPSLER